MRNNKDVVYVTICGEKDIIGVIAMKHLSRHNSRRGFIPLMAVGGIKMSN